MRDFLKAPHITNESSEEFKESKAKLSKKQQAVLSDMQAEVEAALSKTNLDIFSDAAFERENLLRNWIRRVTGVKFMNVSDAEELIHQASNYENSTIFTFHGISFIKTATGMLDRTTNYIEVLENTVIDLQSNKIEPQPELGFWGHIKQAFKCLFKGDKNASEKA